MNFTSLLRGDKRKKKRRGTMFFLLFCLYFAVGSYGQSEAATKQEKQLLDTIIIGVKYNNSLIKNISYDYSIEYQVSKELSLHAKNYLDDQKGLSEVIDHSITSGNLRQAGNKYFISSKTVLVGDETISRHQISVFDGMSSIDLNLKNDRGVIGNSPNLVPSFFDPRFISVAFSDWKSIYDVISDAKTEIKINGLEEIDGVSCYKLTLERLYSNDAGNFISKKTIWIDPRRGFTIKKALSFSPEMERPIIITKFTPVELPGGIWYYKEIVFESDRPELPPGPHTTVTLKIKNIVVNTIFEKDAFMTDINQVKVITDRCAGITFKTQKP